MPLEQDQRISQVVAREAVRLGRFIRRRVSDPGDAEDILQEVFFELVEANRLLMPIEHVTGWRFRTGMRDRWGFGAAAAGGASGGESREQG